MLKEYRSIQEVVGRFSWLRMYQAFPYDELVEIEQVNGEIRRGKVLEVDGDKALVQLLKAAMALR